MADETSSPAAAPAARSEKPRERRSPDAADKTPAGVPAPRPRGGSRTVEELDRLAAQEAAGAARKS